MWGKNETDKPGVSLLNWDEVCMPKKWGGMGIIDLRTQNISLLLRWWWRLYDEPSALWSITIVNLRKYGAYVNGPCFWLAMGSFFWNQLQKLRPLFNWSTVWSIGRGEGISFWQDSWSGVAFITQLNARPLHPYVSLRDAVPAIQLIAPEYAEEVSQVVFTQEEDSIRWKWETNGLYTAKSVYEVIKGGGMIRDSYTYVWKAKVPPTVKIFGFLLLKNRLLTHDVMHRRNMKVPLPCMLCENCPIESAFHIFFLCPYVVHVWYILGNRVGFKLIVIRRDLPSTWEASIGAIRARGGSGVKKE